MPWRPFSIRRAAIRGSDYRLSLRALRPVDEARELPARMVGCPHPLRIVLTSGLTEALNTIIFGCVKSGDRVVTTTTDHTSVLRPLYAIEERGAANSQTGNEE